MDTGHMVWAVMATALVLFMTPGLAFFYGGLVKAKSVISMMMMSIGSIGLIGVLWILFGDSMSRVANPGDFAGNPFGDFALVAADNERLLQSAFAASFAIITVALISGAIADRAKFGAWMVFAGLYAVLVYFPVSAWVWGGGWIQHLGESLGLPDVIDYAGGLVVEINSGAAALALALVLGKRVNFGKGVHQPHNVPLTLIGFGILWFGWFGFNAGAAAFGDMSTIGVIFMNTFASSAAGILGWIVIEKFKDGKATSVGAASGAVAGLVAITPSCANLTPGWSLLLGAIAGIISAYAIELKFKLGFDDSLDVVGLHLVAGLVGTLYLGFFATGTGLFTGGDLGQLAVQLIAALAVLVYSFFAALIIGFTVDKFIGFRIHSDDELAGIDTVVHGELGYALEAD
ncbi:ammonium transporter [Microbacteriaceae bacterium MWH-Ta3]|nr:ammonium transporter [Microbacteriaceae bacterium MWH-Ta3]